MTGSSVTSLRHEKRDIDESGELVEDDQLALKRVETQ